LVQIVAPRNADASAVVRIAPICTGSLQVDGHGELKDDIQVRIVVPAEPVQSRTPTTWLVDIKVVAAD
jgi:hypothetical protein